MVEGSTGTIHKQGEKVNMIIAVTGITGHSGRFFLQELEDNAFVGTVRCLVRNHSNTMYLNDSSLQIEKVFGDVNCYDDLLSLTRNADIVMHIYNIHNSVDIIKASIENSVPRLVMVHTTGVYSKYKMASYEYRKIEETAEHILQHSDIDATILRPTMIFGDLCDRNISKFIKMVDRLPFIPEIERGRGRIQPVNARDLARAYYSVCMKANLPNQYYDLSGARSLSLHELFDLIGTYLGRRVYHASVPMWIGTAGARCVKALSLGKVDYVERVLRMGEDRDYSHDLATSDFGYKPESFEIGLKREVEEYLQARGK